MRAFRPGGRPTRWLAAAYEDRKRAILAEGITHSLTNTVHKGGFIGAVLDSPFRRDKVNFREKFLHARRDTGSLKVVVRSTAQHVKLVKLLGEFIWHHHEHEDELFLVIKGRFRMEFRDRHVWLEEGEFLVVPKGIEHRPVAEEEAHVLLFEPATTVNTGNVRDERTVVNPGRI